MKQIDNVLIAEEGMTLTNGEGFGKKVYLGHGADASEWEEITDAEAAERKRDMEAAADETEAKARAYEILLGEG